MIAVEDVVEHYLDRKAAGEEGPGTYAANAGSILRRWARWVERERGATAVADLGPDSMRGYARDLADRVERGEYAPATARTYYAVVHAFCSWCVDAGIAEEHPATAVDADAILPPADTSPGRPWSADRRDALVEYAKERALEARGDDRLAALRDYALVAAIAHAGLRGSELFRVPDDDRRTGATWEDVDFYTGTVRVHTPSGRIEDVPLPAPARRPLRRYRIALDPPSTEWPLFPTRHAPSIAGRVRTVLRERGEDADALLAESTATELARERAIAPPAITTEGARTVLRRLCDEAGVDVEGESLTPRSARDGREGTVDRGPGARPALRRPRFERSLARFEDVVTVRGGEPATADRRTDGD